MRNATLLATLLLTCAVSIAHDSPEHVVDALTERIASEGPTPALLVRRAYEYQAWGKYPQAEADLNAAIKTDPHYAEAYARLAHVFNAQDKHDAAAKTLAAGLQHAQSEVDTVELLAIRAELHEANGRLPEALADCEAVLKYRPTELDPILQKSHLLARMDKTDERVQWLRSAVDLNPSVVLQTELTEALIDAAQYTEADTRVIQAASNKRWLSAWRIRRGRIHLGLGERDYAEKEFGRALEEINGRLNDQWPDPLLLIEKAAAYALLGETHAAQDTLTQARAAGASPWELWQVHRYLEDQE